MLGVFPVVSKLALVDYGLAPLGARSVSERQETAMARRVDTSIRRRPRALLLPVMVMIGVVAPMGFASTAMPATSGRTYTVTILPTLGAPFDASNAAGINNKGWIVGDANTPDSTSVENATEHATIWRQGAITDLGTLGGPNSSIGFVARPNDTGLISGNAQTTVVDPLAEGWGYAFGCGDPSGGPCSGSQYEVRGFVWKGGAIHALPTLGGNNALAIGGANDRGQIVGTAENAVTDPTCAPPQQLEWRPVIWGPKPGQIEELSVYPGDTVGGTTAINDMGQVVGGSGPCGPPSPNGLNHALVWQDGSRTEIGNQGSPLGGQFDNVPTAINNRGQVVGWSDLPGDATTHAFLWQNRAITDLGVLPGDVSSFAFGVNDRGQVVGNSCNDNGSCRAFIWENGRMSDLNTIIDGDSQGSSYELGNAEGINDRGEIVGFAFDQNTGAGRAFAAVPVGP